MLNHLWLYSPFLLIIGSLSKDAFERHTSTGSVLFAFFHSDFNHISEQIVSIRVKETNNTNLLSVKAY